MSTTTLIKYSNFMFALQTGEIVEIIDDNPDSIYFKEKGRIISTDDGGFDVRFNDGEVVYYSFEEEFEVVINDQQGILDEYPTYYF